MVIRNDGQGILRITVADNLTPGGPTQQTPRSSWRAGSRHCAAPAAQFVLTAR